jgi:hypothetical protein
MKCILHTPVPDFLNIMKSIIFQKCLPIRNFCLYLPFFFCHAPLEDTKWDGWTVGETEYYTYRCVVMNLETLFTPSSV